jgi:hypothetical protein
LRYSVATFFTRSGGNSPTLKPPLNPSGSITRRRIRRSKRSPVTFSMIVPTTPELRLQYVKYAPGGAFVDHIFPPPSRKAPMSDPAPRT